MKNKYKNYNKRIKENYNKFQKYTAKPDVKMNNMQRKKKY